MGGPGGLSAAPESSVSTSGLDVDLPAGRTCTLHSIINTGGTINCLTESSHPPPEYMNSVWICVYAF